MESTQLKISFHQLIDSIDNDKILAKFYGLMSKARNSSPGHLWSRLTKEEQEELILSNIESDNEANLIPHAKIRKKHNKWL